MKKTSDLYDEEDAERTRVYISASVRDEKARFLYDYLYKHGYKPWSIERDIPPGVSVSRKSQMEMRDSEFVIFCISRYWKDSRWQVEEVFTAQELARSRGKELTVIPIRMDDSPVPRRLSDVQAIDLSDSREFGQVLRVLEWHVEQQLEEALSTEFQSLYLERLVLKNIRCFESLELTFVDEKEPALWNMLIGDNAAGKSTVLRCIALGLAGESETASLMADVPGNFVRPNAKYGMIELTLRGSSSGIPRRIKTRIEPSANGPESVRKTTDPAKDFPWDQIFTVGYGTQRSRVASLSHQGYSQRVAVNSLFDPEASLLNPEVVLLRQPTEIRHRLERKLLSVLMLDTDRDRLVFNSEGVSIEGPWGTLPLEVLSDGFRSTSQWILDFLGQSILAGRLTEKSDPGGILLIDEIEQHLHPQWQRLIVQRLRQQFPNTQVFSTTHTPLAASGISDIPSATLTRFDRELSNITTATQLDRNRFKGIRADQWLASEAFGLVTTKSPGAVSDMQRYLELRRTTPSDDPELVSLQKRIREQNSFGESDYEREIGRAVEKVLDARRKLAPKDPLSEETREALRGLFESEGAE